MAGCWFYILRCADGSYYAGTSRLDDIEMRVSQHNQATFKGHTTKRRPVVLAYAVHFENIVEATDFEQRIKGWSRAKREALIRGEYDALLELARRRQPFRRALEPPSSFETPATRAPQDEGSRGR
jgi:putative endonuclease